MSSEKLPSPIKSMYSQYVKRVLDILLSSLAIIFLSPLFLIVSIMEIIIHGTPVIYCTKRPGRNNRIINLYKFRSMTNERDEYGYLLPEEQRLTKFGLFLRKTSIDELPELFCILCGDMSIIGPRPLLIEYLNMYNERHIMRQSVRPGLACVRIKREGLNKTWTWRDQFENDIYYIEHISFKTDVLMVLAVIREVFKVSDYRANDTRIPFNGTNLDDIGSKSEMGIIPHFDSISK